MEIQLTGNNLCSVNLTKGECLKEGEELAILSVGTTAATVVEALESRKDKDRIAHYDLGVIKPLDTTLLTAILSKFKRLITVEDAALAGGVGSTVLTWAVEKGFQPNLKRIGLADVFIPHGATSVLKEHYGLDVKGINQAIDDHINDGICS